jgi:hypothetical protein
MKEGDSKERMETRNGRLIGAMQNDSKGMIDRASVLYSQVRFF